MHVHPIERRTPRPGRDMHISRPDHAGACGGYAHPPARLAAAYAAAALARNTPHLCAEPYCGEVLLTAPGYCEQHRKQHRAPRRTGPDRGYTSRTWRRVCDAYIRAHPDCEAVGCDQPAALVHHRDGRRPADPGANAWSNLAALCARCHRRLTNGHDVQLEPPDAVGVG
jgi:5-methylcytosine-specific restriction endonuclease McrA